MSAVPVPRPTTIISGGQTGADFGALIAAEQLGIETAGYAPLGYLTDDGPMPLLAEYKIKEAPTADWAARDILNVEMCDGLIAFLFNVPMTGRGTEKTINCVATGRHEQGREWGPIYQGSTLGNTYQTIDVAADPAKPDSKPKSIIIIYDLAPQNVELVARDIRTFLRTRSVTKLMISGPCQRTFLETPGINVEQLVKSVLIKVFA